ncbi:MAG: hypothetical protein LBU53_05420 [Zoogloeaceae bacterium]|nr:hypothetical protein [Zoogloeaceae bacterium]
MTRHHAIDPRHFLRATHDFPDLEKMLAFDPAVKTLLKKLPGRKILYFNNPAQYH